jgi:iron complex outermembrane receptor protein
MRPSFDAPKSRFPRPVFSSTIARLAWPLLSRASILAICAGLAFSPAAAQEQEPAAPGVKPQAAKTKAKPKAGGEADTPAGALATITVTAKSGSAADQPDQGFVGTDTGTATRTDTPIAQVPQSIQVVTKDLMKSRQAQSAIDALRNVSGVTVEQKNGFTTVQVRGFATLPMIDGVTAGGHPGVSGGGEPPMVGVERIEVLKGADSIVGGEMEPGGIVNLVRKRPQKQLSREVTLEAGSFGHVMGAYDIERRFALQRRTILNDEVCRQRSNGGHRYIDDDDIV